MMSSISGSSTVEIHTSSEERQHHKVLVVISFEIPLERHHKVTRIGMGAVRK